jgi:hypothetical protein
MVLALTSMDLCISSQPSSRVMHRIRIPLVPRR